jgi:hypothetical protein
VRLSDRVTLQLLKPTFSLDQICPLCPHVHREVDDLAADTDGGEDEETNPESVSTASREGEWVKFCADDEDSDQWMQISPKSSRYAEKSRRTSGVTMMAVAHWPAQPDRGGERDDL